MRRAASWPTRNTPSRLTSITPRHSLSLIFRKIGPRRHAGVVDEHRNGPQLGLRGIECAHDRRAIGDIEFDGGRFARRTRGFRIGAAPGGRGGARPAATLAPASASTRAKCRPRPEDAPVTSAVLPRRENRSLAVMVLAFSVLGSQAFIPGTWPSPVRPTRTPLCRRMA